MPYMTDGKRDYRKEYDKYQGRPEQIKNRDERNKARATEVRHLGHNINGDVDHIKPLSKGGSPNNLSNLRVESAHKNRSFARNSDGSLKRNGK